jgi:hypothetical protein
MTITLRPKQGGFLRPFGCGWFIREFLLGHGLEGSPKINPDRGATQADINYEYKSALVRAIARDHTEKRISDMVERGVDVTEEMADMIYQDELKKIPHKYTRMRYHSFLVYFGMIKRLGWVEATGEVESSAAQEPKPGVINPQGQPRTYYRLTKKGKAAADAEWSNPLFTLYPETFLKHHPGRYPA